MRSLIQQLENAKYSTIIYVFGNNSRRSDENLLKADDKPQRLGDFFGYCDVLSSELSIIYNKSIIFWPCPKVRVSSYIYFFKLIYVHRIMHVVPANNTISGTQIAHDTSHFLKTSIYKTFERRKLLFLFSTLLSTLNYLTSLNFYC